MARASSLLLLVISHLSLLSWAEDVTRFNPKCPSLPCGILGNISFPFTNRRHPECGLFVVDECDKPIGQKIQLDGLSFYISDIKQDNTVKLHDLETSEYLKKKICGSFKNYTLFISPFYSFEIPSNLTMLKCLPATDNLANSFKLCNDSSQSIFFYNQPTDKSSIPPAQCSVIHCLVTRTQKSVVLHNMHAGGFFLQVIVTKECYKCHSIGGKFQSDSKGKFICSGAKTGIKITGRY